MTPGQPSKDDCYIPPVIAGTHPPKDPNNTFWIIIAVLFIGIVFIIPLLIIAGFAVGVLGNVEHTRVVAATVQQNGQGTIVVIYQGGQDAGEVVSIPVTVTDSTGQVQTKILESDAGTAPLNSGAELVFEGAFTGKDHVIATAHFTDGTDRVILDIVV